MKLERTNLKSKYMEEIYQQWLQTSILFPDFLPETSFDTKLINEKYIDNVSNNFNYHFNKLSKKVFTNKKKWQIKTLKLLHTTLNTESVINIHSILDNDRLSAIENEVGLFFSKARIFAPDFTFSDIGQAIRNYIVFIMFKEMNHIDTEFSTPCFGYSMLYPFTDNYIDNPCNSLEDKKYYNDMIREKIKGNVVIPKSVHQEKTCQLLDYIESQYNRDCDNSIYTLLLMMLEAQEISMTKQKIPALSQEDRLHISIYKGGISVLIDRYLINKELTSDDITFYLSFGLFLQLADDLLDITDDLKTGNQTIFTLNTSSDQIEQLINKLLNFVHDLFLNYTAINDNFKSFVLSNCYYLILYGVSENSEYLSLVYRDMILEYLPVSYSYLQKTKENLKQLDHPKVQRKYKKLLDEFMKKLLPS